MPTVSLNVKHQIVHVIKKFKFEELESAVLPIFPEFKWDKIKCKLADNHESFTTMHAARIIDELIDTEKISNQILKDRLSTLEIIDVSRHYKKKVWYGYEFKGNNDKNSLILQEIPRQIKQSFKVYRMEMDVQAVEYNGIVFLSVKEKSKKRRLKTIQSVFFSLVMNETFFFCSKKIVLKNILLAVACGLGYLGFKQVKLMGKDIPSLIQMLLSRKTSIMAGGLIKHPVQFKQVFPITTTLGLDFTQHKQRKEYAKKIFGDNAPTFEFLRVKCLDQNWKHKDALLKLPADIIYTGIEFRSPNLIQFLNNLIIQQILMIPIPCYAANILTIGRNDLTMKER